MVNTLLIYLAFPFKNGNDDKVWLCGLPTNESRYEINFTHKKTTWHLRVYRNGRLDWNGQTITAKELEVYLRDFRALKDRRQILSVEFQNDISSKIKSAVSRAVIQSELCKEGRCMVGRWNAKRVSID